VVHAVGDGGAAFGGFVNDFIGALVGGAESVEIVSGTEDGIDEGGIGQRVGDGFDFGLGDGHNSKTAKSAKVRRLV
jgi:hypothetical protein